MTYHTFQYAALKYRPSILLDEAVNVGLFFCFDNGHVAFLKSQNWARIKALNPEADIATIKRYLTSFEKKAESLRLKRIFLEDTAEKIWSGQFLVPDSNSFQLSALRTGETANIGETLDYYSRTFFPPPEAEKARAYKNEVWIADRFATALRERDGEKLHFFQKSKKIEVRGAFAEFDYAWQNGTENLVKPLGFDLLTREGILDKGNLWQGKLINLRETVADNNQRIDFLVSGPDRGQPALFEAYEEAFYNLEKLDFPKTLRRENEIAGYVDYALENFRVAGE